jgi:hypothetical protein
MGEQVPILFLYLEAHLADENLDAYRAERIDRQT